MKQQMMRFLLLLLIACPLFAGTQVIYAPATIDPALVSDFRYLLKESTGKNWTSQPAQKPSQPGIYLLLDQQSSFTTKESFRLQSNGKDQLVITASSPEGLVFGFYRHLRNLGFRFYLPDDLYTIIPKLDHPYGSRQDKTSRPHLQVRNFFGTGGYGTNTPDPDKTVEKEWTRWKLRNGFGNSYHLAGHRGENFILDNYEVLQKNPSWLASPLTGDRHKDVGIKLNYGNKAALDYYINWTLKPLTEPSFKLPPPNHTEFVSIEPSDGGGFITAQQGGKKISISDQVYGAANRAAEKLDKLFPHHPNIGVNLYAYSGHAAPPSFKLHPRVYVQLVPYQFQNIAFGPSFIKLWSSKAQRFGLYDYLNYTDAQYDIPGGLTIDEAMKRLIHSVRNGSEGSHYETTFSKFATGIPLWIMGRYMADGQEQWEQHLEKAVNDLYGSAAPKVQSLFRLFYRDAGFGPQYLGYAAQLLKEASASATQPLIQQRLQELKLYLHHIHLVYQSRDINKGKLHERLVPLATYAWKLFPSRIVHSYRIMQLVSYAFLNTDKNDPSYAYYQQLHNLWFPEGDRNKSGWASIPQGISRQEAEKNFSTILSLYPPSLPAALLKMNEIPLAIQSAGLKPRQQIIFGGGPAVRGYFGVYTQKPAVLQLRYLVQGNEPLLRISSVDNAYTADTAITIQKTTGTVRIRIPAGETTIFINAADGSDYRMEAVLDQGIFFFDSAPRGKMAFYKSFNAPYQQYTYDPLYYPSHFYMPDVKTLEYKVQLNSLSFTTPRARKIQPELLSTEHGGFEYRRFSVQQDERKRIWKAEISGNYNYNFLNIPDRYFLLEPR